MIQAGLLGGVFIGVLSALPVINIANFCCCLWIISGGMLATYVDQAPGRTQAVGRGAIDGLVAGVVGAVVWLVASLALDVVLGPLQDRLLSFVLEMNPEMPPEARAWLEGLSDRSAGPLRYVFGFIVHLFAGTVFGTLGGLLGATFFWREAVPPALGGPPPLPPQ